MNVFSVLTFFGLDLLELLGLPFASFLSFFGLLWSSPSIVVPVRTGLVKSKLYLPVLIPVIFTWYFTLFDPPGRLGGDVGRTRSGFESFLFLLEIISDSFLGVL